MSQASNSQEFHHSSITSQPFFPQGPQTILSSKPLCKKTPCYLNLDQFKISPCHIKKQHNHKQCMYYHSAKDQRRTNNNFYDEICVFITNNQPCQLGHDCPFSHNQVEERYMPRNYKKKFCYYFEIGKVENCEYGSCCSYAHSDTEINLELLHKMKQDEEFYIFRFKTIMCPFFNLKHDKGTCVYAHNYQDYRRRPDMFNYELKPCPFWKYDAYVHNYKEGCPYGEKCGKCHGWKEYDFHPLYYKTAPCPNQARCYKNLVCQFYHDEKDQRFLNFLNYCFILIFFYSIGTIKLQNKLKKKSQFKRLISLLFLSNGN